MRFTISAAALAAFVSSALAQTAGFDPITAPAKDQELAAGSSFDIVWQPSATYTGSVTLSLLGGKSPETLTTVATIKSGVDNSAGKFAWTIDSALGKDATYGIQITLDSDKTVFQYSFPFHIKAGYDAGSTGSASNTVTYTLSSATSTSSSSSNSSSYTTVSPPGNYSSTKTSGPTGTTLYTTGGSGSTPKPTSSSPGTVPTSGAQAVAAGSLAMFGGLAMAVFAL